MGVNGIYGLSGSGLDIESLVKMGMSAKNKQYDKMEQQEIANTWLKEAYNDVYNDLTTYKYGTLSTYKMQSNLNAMAATSSNSGVVTATANGAAAAMNHTVTVDSVASNAYLLTTQHEVDGKLVNYGVTRANLDAKTSNKLVDVIFSSYEVKTDDDDGTGNYIVNGNAVKGSDIAISLKLKDTTGDNAKEYTLTYTYDELFKGEKTLNDFASAIAKTGANIQGGYDTANDSFSLYNKTSGESNVISISADNGNTATLLDNLNLGRYDAVNDELGPRIDFTSNDAIATTMVSTGTISNTAKSVSMKDVLGLSATSVKNDDDGSYTITVKDNNENVLGTFVKYADGTYAKNEDGITYAKDNVAFSMNLSNGKADGNATISFTLGELFNLDDIGKRSSLRSNAGLDELANKINETGLGIVAKYDAVSDSFSLTNETGRADITALGDYGTDVGAAQKSVAETLISNLHLQNSSSITYKSVTNKGTLGGILGITSTMVMGYESGTKIAMTVRQDGSNVASIPATKKNTANYYNGTYANQKLFSFTISDTTNNKSATIDVTYGDVINFAAMQDKGDGCIYYNDQSGTRQMLNQDAGTVGVQAAQNNLGALAAKIEAAAEASHMNVKASYDSASGQFSLLNSNGDITISGGSPFSVESKLKLVKSDDPPVAYKSSSAPITRASDTSTDETLSGALGLNAVKNGDNITIIKADGTTYNVEDANTEAFSLKVGDSSNSAVVSFTYAELFDINGSGTLKSTADLSTLAEKINEISGVNVTANYNTSSGEFTLSNDSGYATLTGDDELGLGASIVSMLGLKESDDTVARRQDAGNQHTYKGSDAKVTVDGKSYINDTNKLTVAGVTYTFLDSTKEAVGQRVTISVSQDTDKIVDYMKSFVDDYNKLLDSLNEKLSEQKYSDYKPLSKRQEDEMTEKQIDKWNEKAKSGLLYHNSEIQALVSAMREAIYTKVDAVDSEYNTLSSIGITTTNTKGHLTIDTDKLKKALADDPDCVYQLFASDQDSTYIAGTTNKNKITTAQSKLDYANTGVANRLYNVMTNHMSKISDIAGTSKSTDDQSYLGKLITNMQTKMSNFKTMMTAYENKLYKRYDAMEVALSRLNMQLGYISGSFS